MTRKQNDQAQPTGQAANEQGRDPAATAAGQDKPLLPPASGQPPCDPHCVEVTGITPEGIRVDPDITEGHPGYQESGGSEIIPPNRTP